MFHTAVDIPRMALGDIREWVRCGSEAVPFSTSFPTRFVSNKLFACICFYLRTLATYK